ncbi:hypothetical protein A6U94_21890 [Agrobacterium tumefaciens]|nr:hypothetical protein A6U94_21890 [Agrobacterium tumefaciens]
MRAMQEFQRVGMTAFLSKYTNGFPPHYLFLRHEGEIYPLKALWAAAHRSATSARTFNSVQARNGLRKLGFLDAIKIDGKERDVIILDESHVVGDLVFAEDVKIEAAIEGERQRKETVLIRRNATIVAKVKRELGCDCQVCGFNFGEIYGKHGQGFIEAHHVEPLSNRNESRATSIEDFAMLCANCHRMIHRGDRVLSLKELKKIVQNQSERRT